MKTAPAVRQPDPQPVEYRLKSDLLAVRNVVLQILEDLADAAVQPRNMATFELVLAEVLNNVVEHAYGVGTCGDIRVLVADRGSVADVKVIDKGRPMPNLAVPEGNSPDIAVRTGDLPEGGFGWFIFQSCTAGVRYERANETNHLYFTVNLVD